MAVACQFVSRLFLISVQLLESWKSFDPVCDLGNVKNGGFSKWIKSSLGRNLYKHTNIAKLLIPQRSQLGGRQSAEGL